MGANLEPGDVPAPRRATPDAAHRLIEAGAAFLCLTANPGTGTTLADLARATAAIRAATGHEPVIWAGKMHQAGAPETLTPAGVAALVGAGADAALVPLPGTVPGVTREAAAEIVQPVHAAGWLAVGTVGTSQEGSHPPLMDALGLVAKEIGVDIHTSAMPVSAAAPTRRSSTATRWPSEGVATPGDAWRWEPVPPRPLRSPRLQ